MSTSHRRRLALVFGAVVFACVLLAHSSGLTLGLAYLSPAVFVFVLLCSGRYPGERLLLPSTRPPRSNRKALAVKARSYPLARMPRGGGLLASALAGRAPPLSRRPESKFSTV